MPELIVDPRAGFCPGVKRAISEAEKYAQKHSQVFSLGELVHNPGVMASLRTKGIESITDMEDLPQGAHLIIRAHGVPPRTEAILRKRKVPYLDLTCPIVKEVQKKIASYKTRGYNILIAGKPGHPEVTGLLGYTGSRGCVISRPDEARHLELTHPSVLIAQTTTSLSFFKEVEKILLQKKTAPEVQNTICRFVLQKQEWLRQSAERCEAGLIVGGKNSSNTRQLYNIVAASSHAYWIESVSELQDLPLSSFSSLVLSAGTSTPVTDLDSVKNCLKTQYEFKIV